MSKSDAFEVDSNLRTIRAFLMPFSTLTSYISGTRPPRDLQFWLPLSRSVYYR